MPHSFPTRRASDRPLNLSLDVFADKRVASLLPDEVVDPLAHSFRQPNDVRFHFERRPSHRIDLTGPTSCAITTLISDIGYCPSGHRDIYPISVISIL